MRLSTLPAGLAASLAAGGAMAQSATQDLQIRGEPVDGAVGFQPAASSIAHNIHWLDDMLLIIIAAICALVLGLIGYVVLRFNRKANPEPATFTHNSPLEITWTIVPIAVLIFIGVFSLPVLFHEQTIPEGDVTVNVTGHQWYWGYEYPEHDFSFLSYMLERDELADHGYSQHDYKLATDTAMVVPVNKTIVVNTTGADVIHSWTVPAFGVKQDAVPGRSAALWFRPEKTGIYFGQCSELCGQNHAFMPITVKVVSQEAYEKWLDSAIEEYAGTPRNVTVASAE